MLSSSATSATLESVLDTLSAGITESDSLSDDVVTLGPKIKDTSAKILDLEARTSLLGSKSLAVFEVSEDLLSLCSVCHLVSPMLLQHEVT